MLRSLFSAVSGMQAHQTKLDVIGNNIANVNTYGFKSSRARFQDVYYQTLQSATGGDNNKGGTNASQVGYGAQLAGVDLNMGRSALQSTGRPMDIAITGEGFFQVMDSDGNIFYTRAGNLQLDNNSGNLVDANGYTVLGVTGDPLGKAAGADKIHLSIPGKNNAQSTNSQTINGIEYTITSQNTTGAANVTISFRLDDTLPDGADVVVKSGDLKDSSITVSVNKNAVFTSLADFNSKMNAAITRANNGKAHPAGDFTITAVPADKIFKTSLTGEELLGENFGIKPGVQTFTNATDIKDGIFGGIKPSGTSTEPKFTASGKVSYEMTFQAATATEPAAWIIQKRHCCCINSGKYHDCKEGCKRLPDTFCQDQVGDVCIPYEDACISQTCCIDIGNLCQHDKDNGNTYSNGSAVDTILHVFLFIIGSKRRRKAGEPQKHESRIGQGGYHPVRPCVLDCLTPCLGKCTCADDFQSGAYITGIPEQGNHADTDTEYNDSRANHTDLVNQ